MLMLFFVFFILVTSTDGSHSLSSLSSSPSVWICRTQNCIVVFISISCNVMDIINSELFFSGFSFLAGLSLHLIICKWHSVLIWMCPGGSLEVHNIKSLNLVGAGSLKLEMSFCQRKESLLQAFTAFLTCYTGNEHQCSNDMWEYLPVGYKYHCYNDMWQYLPVTAGTNITATSICKWTISNKLNEAHK